MAEYIRAKMYGLNIHILQWIYLYPCLAEVKNFPATRIFTYISGLLGRLPPRFMAKLKDNSVCIYVCMLV